MSYSTCIRIPAQPTEVDVSSSSSSRSTVSDNNPPFHHSAQTFLALRQSTHYITPRHFSHSQHQTTTFDHDPTDFLLTQRSGHSGKAPPTNTNARTSPDIEVPTTSSTLWQHLPYFNTISCMQDCNTEVLSGPQDYYSLSAAINQHPPESIALEGGSYTDWAMPQPSVEATTIARPFNDRSRQFQRVNEHHRTPSASTVASVASTPSGHHQQQSISPLIVNGEASPRTAAFHANLAAQQYPKAQSFNLASYPGTAGNPLLYFNAQQAMQGFSNDYNNLEDIAPGIVHSSRHSMSSLGNVSPATPPSMDVNVDNVTLNDNNDGASAFVGSKTAHGNVQLFRTESQAFQDELYNPSTEFSTSTPVSKPTQTYLSPHQSVMSERLQAANNIRSQSPGLGVSRERSPFRDNSPFAPTSDWRSPAGMGTAAGMRQYQKEQAEKAELAQHMPKLRREPTKTISPKDALLDFHDADQPPLFQDNVPLGYKQHNTGVDLWTPNLASDAGSMLGSLQAPAVSTSFRPDVSAASTGENFSFGNMSLVGGFHQNQPSPANFQPPVFQSNKTGQYAYNTDTTPQFPSMLTSMESSISDNGPSSSAEDPKTVTVAQRPADVRANTGTYTCTYHGCTQRFDTHVNLQKHKREAHRTTQHLQAEQQLSPRESSTTASSRTSSPSESSPRSEVSPAPSGSELSSAALLARNSQAGPHKCTRINPSTGKPCNTMFSRPYDLTRHEDTIHNARKQKVRCPLCREEKTFSRNDALTRHMRVVHPDVDSYHRRGRRE